MSEVDKSPERLGAKAIERIARLELVVKELLLSIKEIEKKTGEAYMAEGEFYGIKFIEE